MGPGGGREGHQEGNEPARGRAAQGRPTRPPGRGHPHVGGRRRGGCGEAGDGRPGWRHRAGRSRRRRGGQNLYVSASRGLRSTQSWITQQAEARLDALEQRIQAHLRPIGEQADWIAGALADGRIDLGRPAELDAFMFGALGSTPHVSDLGIVDPFGRARRWSRGAQASKSADWSQ